MASHSTKAPSKTNDSTSYMYHVKHDGKTIKTTVTNNATIAENWVNEILLAHANDSMMVVGLDVERIHPIIQSPTNKSATLQLCIDTKCLILQLFHLDEIPQSFKGFLLNPKFTFVGFEDDILKLNNEYKLVCSKSLDILEILVNKSFGSSLLPCQKDLVKLILGVILTEKPKHVWMSNWETKVLNETQVAHACIEAYVSYLNAHEILLEV